MAFDFTKLIELAPFLMGAFRGPSPEGNAMLEGYVKGQHGKRGLADQEREIKRQELLDLLQQQQVQFSQAGRLRDDARADEALALQRETAGLSRQSATLGKVKTLQEMAGTRAGQLADDPAADASTPDAQNRLAEDLLTMTQQGGMAPGAARGMLPNMTGLIAEREKKHYREQLEKAEKSPIYAGLVGTPEFEEMTVRDRKGQLIKIKDIRAQLGDQLTDASGAAVAPSPKAAPVTAGTESERAADLLGKIREATDPAANAKFERQYADLLKAKKEIGQADDKSDPLLMELRAMRIEELKRRSNNPDMSPAQFNIANRLADDFARDSKDFVQRAQSYGTVQAAAKDPSPAGDMSLIFAFMKMLDPGSVVREGEFATAQNTAGVPVRIRNAYNKVMSGERLAPEQRTDFVTQAQKVYDSAKQRQSAIVETYTGRAKTANVPADMVVMDFGRGVDVPEPTSTGAVTPKPGPAPVTAPPKVGDFREANGERRRWSGTAWVLVN